MVKRSFIVSQFQPGIYSIECLHLKFKPTGDVTLVGALWFFLEPNEVRVHRDCSVDIYQFMRSAANAVMEIHHDWHGIRGRVIDLSADEVTRTFLEDFLCVP